MGLEAVPHLASVRVTPASDAVVRRIHHELARRLPAVHARVLEELGAAAFVAYWTVVSGQRILGRLERGRDGLERTIAALRASGLECERGRFDMMPGREAVGGARHAGHLVPRDTEPHARAVVYFSALRELVLAADAVERGPNDALVGRLYGYPECCVRFFAAAGAAPDKTPACVPRIGPFSSLLNPAMGPLYGFRLLFHFPCSVDCAASRRLVEERLAHLQQHAPSLAEFAAQGAGLLLYGPQLGIALATRYHAVGDDAFRLEEVVTRSPRSIELISTLPAGALIRCRAPRDFDVGGIQCRDGQNVLAQFT